MRSQRFSSILNPVATLTLALTVLQLLFPLANATYILEIPSGDEECLVIRIPGNTASVLTGDFEWVDDISPQPGFVILQNEDFESLYESPDGSPGGEFSVVGKGTFHLCLSNGIFGGDDLVAFEGYVDEVTRHVAVNYRVRPQMDEMNGSGEQGADDEKTAHLLKLSGEVLDGIDFLLDHQTNWRAREAEHFKLAKSTYRRVMKWTLAEAGILVVVSAAQVMYLRKFFERKRYL